MSKLECLVTSMCLTFVACVGTKTPGSSDATPRLPDDPAGKAVEPFRVQGTQDITAMPEVDTGGFLIYHPPKDVMLQKGEAGIAAWTDPDWTNPRWELVGFAYSRMLIEGEPLSGFEIQLWLAKQDIAGTPVKKFMRIGIENPAPNISVSDGPLMYDVQLDAQKAKLNKSEFLSKVKLILGKDLPFDSKGDFQYWLVTETYKP